MGWLKRMTEPDIGRHLLRDEGEDIVDIVRKHWVVYIGPDADRATSRWSRSRPSCSPTSRPRGSPSWSAFSSWGGEPLGPWRTTWTAS